MASEINVLFMQSQTFFGADSMIHGLLMRHLDRSRVNVHVACSPGTGPQPSAALRELAAIPNLHLRPTFFGPMLYELPRRQAVRAGLVGALPTAASLAALADYTRRRRIDIVHCTEKPRDAFYGWLLARAAGAKCVIHVHVKAAGWMSPLTRRAMRSADALLGVSAFVARSLAESGYPAARTAYVHNSLDLAGWPRDADGVAIRREFGIAPGAPLLAIISRLFSWKGHTELLHALARVKQQVPGVRLLLVGEDDPRAGPTRGSYTGELRALAHALGLAGQIIFTGFRRDIPQLLAACDIFTMPSYEEPFGVVFLEAMAARRPIVALDNGGTPEVVEHGLSGLLAPPGDIEGLAANIVTLLGDPALRARMGEYGRRRVEQYFTPRRMADEVEQFYRLVKARGLEREALFHAFPIL